MTILVDLFKYFSQFVPASVVENSFNNNHDHGQMSILSEVQQVTNENRNNDFKAYIFGVNQEAITEKISHITGMYLFVEYEKVTSSIDSRVDVKSDSFHVSVTVAEPLKETTSQIEELISQDKTLKAISDIRKVMRDDFDETAGVQYLEFPSTLTPFVAPALAHSFGWSMDFFVKGIDMI